MDNENRNLVQKTLRYEMGTMQLYIETIAPTRVAIKVYHGSTLITSKICATYDIFGSTMDAYMELLPIDKIINQPLWGEEPDFVKMW